MGGVAYYGTYIDNANPHLFGNGGGGGTTNTGQKDYHHHWPIVKISILSQYVLYSSQ
jgi:hypothetical protein